MARAKIDPTIGSGDLDKRVTLLQPVYNQFQDEIVSYQPVADVWAAVEPDMAMEVNESGRTVETIMVNMYMRYRRDVAASWRIQDHEHVYEIKGMMDIARRRVTLQLNCQEVL
jgi:SPP1 family predicted phage head-tail adaptor